MGPFFKNRQETAGEIAHRKEMEAKEQLLKQERVYDRLAEIRQEIDIAPDSPSPVRNHIKEALTDKTLTGTGYLGLQLLDTPAAARDLAVAEAARSITALCDKLAAMDLPAAITGLTKAHGLTSILSALVGKNGIDARRLKQDSLEVATLVQMAVEMFQEKLASGGGSTKADVDPELHDAEKDFKEEG